VKKFKDILALLQSDITQDYSPPLNAKPPANNPGLIQIFCALLPNNIGLNMHRQLNQEQVKQLTSFDDYITMFQAVSSKLNDLSIGFDINNNRFNSSILLNTSGEFNQVKTGGTNSYNNNNNNNSNILTIIINIIIRINLLIIVTTFIISVIMHIMMLTTIMMQN